MKYDARKGRSVLVKLTKQVEPEIHNNPPPPGLGKFCGVCGKEKDISNATPKFDTVTGEEYYDYDNIRCSTIDCRHGWHDFVYKGGWFGRGRATCRLCGISKKYMDYPG